MLSSVRAVLLVYTALTVARCSVFAPQYVLEDKHAAHDHSRCSDDAEHMREVHGVYRAPSEE